MMNKYNFQVGDYCLCTSIGNRYVKITENYSQTQPPFKRMFRVWGGGLTWCVPEEDCLPIEITEEWLKLNSFNLDTFLQETEYEEEFKLWISDDHRLQISNASNTIDGGYHAHMDNDRYETIGSLDVQYTHQLQHLFRDCEYKFEPKFK